MDRLAEIVAAKRREIEPLIRPVREIELSRLGEGARAARRPSFVKALGGAGQLSVIAEIKRRSPSAGEIKAGMDAVEQARLYHNAEVQALSVLTDEPYFGGHLRDLWEVTDFLTEHGRALPCLRKDFMVHPVQVIEAAEAGASCILIIVRCLADDEIKALAEAAELAGLDVLYEIHEEPELERAIRFQPRILGVNNRDLKRFVTDLAITETLLPQIPTGVVKVSESGIFDGEDAARVRAAGADAILVGEALMRADDTEALVAELQVD
jgi:indole-3-glycerol phosphate synthase